MAAVGTASDRAERPGTEPGSPSNWAGVGSIAAGTFLLVTTEFLPIGLLSSLAADMQVTEGMAGLAVTAPGLVAAFAAPILVLLARNTDRRTIVVALTLAIVASNVIAALAPNFTVFLAGRLVLGLAVGGLWAFAVAVGRRLVPDSAGARATAIISAAISAGTVFGMPVGAVAGDWAGWRLVFAANAVLGLIVTVVQVSRLPPLPTAAGIGVGNIAAFAKIPMARIGLIASAFVAAGHFIGYTFLEPYLRGTLSMDQTGIALALTGYAVAGIAGSFAGERLAVRDVRSAFMAAANAVGATMIAAALSADTPAIAFVMVMAWGFAFGAVPVCVQIWMFTASPRLFEAGSALMVSAFQIALAAGAAIGGALVDTSGVVSAYLAGGVVCIAGALIPVTLRPRAAPGISAPLASGDTQ